MSDWNCSGCGEANLAAAKKCWNCGTSSAAPRSHGAPSSPAHGVGGEVIVTDIRMPFWSMVTFMIKWAIASIPATIILFVLVLLLADLLGGLLGGLARL